MNALARDIVGAPLAPALADLWPDLTGTPWAWIILSDKHDVRCLVDAEDYPWLAQNNWNISWGSRTRWQLYGKRNIGRERATVRMHRVIMMRAEPRDDDVMAALHVDHINGQTLDNRRINLRWVTDLQNQGNKRRREHRPSLKVIARRLVDGWRRELGAVLEEVPF